MSGVLPPNWTVTMLSEVADWSSGGTPKATEAKYYNGDIPWLVIMDLNNEIVTKSAKKITQLGFENSSAKWVDIGSVMVAMYGSIGKLGIAGIRCTTNQAIAFTTRIWGTIPNKYIFYYLQYNAPELLKIGQGGAQKNISQSILKMFPFLLPPLNEQKRIVAKLDAIMPRIDSVKERLEKIPAILKRFRQSVLTAAVTGKLTEKWREEHPDVESADILLEKIKIYRMKNCTIASKLSAIEKKESGNSSFLDEEWSYSLPDTWMHCEIDSIGDVFNGSTPSRKVDSYWNGQINWVRSGEVANVRISSTRERITQEGFENSSVKLFPKGTVLVAMIGEGKTRGQAAILDVESTCNQNVAAIVINHGYVLSKYLYSWFLMQYERNRTLGSGSGPQALNCQRVREIDFMLPPLDEQQEIVRQVDKLFALADKVEEHYQKARARVEALAQSVLAKAFRGELVPQNPDDEPAEKLLQRIKEEKAKMENELKTTSRSARGTRRNGTKTQRAGAEEKQAGEP